MEQWRKDLYLAHHGIKGMRWGIRRTPEQLGHPRASLKTRFQAKKDAKESARAEMYYGEGAGNRRKLVNARVQSRSKDPAYKEVYEQYRSKQNMDRHAAAAKRERTLNDVGKNVNRVYNTGRKIAAIGATAATVVALAGYAMGDNRVQSMLSMNVADLTSNSSYVRRGKRAWTGNKINPMLDFRQTL